MSAMSFETIERAIHAWVVSASELAPERVYWASQNGARPSGPGACIVMSLSVDAARAGHDAVFPRRNVLPFALASVAVDATTNLVTRANHGLQTGDGPLKFVSTATPAPSDVWVVRVDADTFRLAASFLDAVAVSPVIIDFTAVGAGPHSLEGTATTMRVGREAIVSVTGPRELVLDLQCFGGPGAASRQPAEILHDVVTATALPSVGDVLGAAGVGVLTLDEVRPVGMQILNAAYFEPRAVTTVRLSAVSSLSEFAGIIERVNVETTLLNPGQ